MNATGSEWAERVWKAVRDYESDRSDGAVGSTISALADLRQEVVAKERERCAKIIEAQPDVRIFSNQWIDLSGMGTPVQGAIDRKKTANAIRAETKESA